MRGGTLTESTSTRSSPSEPESPVGDSSTFLSRLAGARDARDAARLIWDFLTRRRGNGLWTGVVRGSGLLALAGLLLIYLVPSTAPLVGFEIVTLWINGPFSPFMPVGYESVVMLLGRLYPPLLIAVLGIVGGLYVEFLNYYLYGRLLEMEAAEGLRTSRPVQYFKGIFDRRPFFTTWFCAWSPVPFWAIRFLAPLSGYPVRKYLVATFLGRFPKIWFFAALGVYWDVPNWILISVVVGSFVLGLAVYAYKRWTGRQAPEPEVMGLRAKTEAGSQEASELRSRQARA